ncbi:DNA translocase FtsK 4TM domain-containing protein, partial [Photobacterium damselae]
MRKVKGKKLRQMRLSGVQRIIESFLIISILVAIYIMVALISFNPADPSWSQTAWQEPVQNAAGTLGAMVADTFFFTFGSLAYVFPVVLVLFSWLLFRRRAKKMSADYMVYGTRLLGLIILLMTSCALADLNFDDIWYFSSGGVVGDVVSNITLPMLNVLGTTLVMMFLWAIGFTLFTGISWVSIVDTIGEKTIGSLTWILNKIRPDKSERIRAFATEIPAEVDMPYAQVLADIDDDLDADDALLASYSEPTLDLDDDKESIARQEPTWAPESTPTIVMPQRQNVAPTSQQAQPVVQQESVIAPVVTAATVASTVTHAQQPTTTPAVQQVATPSVATAPQSDFNAA